MILIIVLCFCLGNCFLNKEAFDTNLFFKELPNIFLNDNYLNYDLNKANDKPNYNSLGQISYNSYINSDIVSTKIICANYNNQGDCWDNNHCQWIYKINGGSYCDMAPKWLL
jgi:hypothetical protein